MQPDERTSLLHEDSRVPIITHTTHSPGRSKARIVVLACGIFLIVFAIWVLQGFARPVWPENGKVSFKELKELINTTPDPDKARQSTEYYASGPHLAGANLSQVLWTQDLWASYGVESCIESYEVYLNRPVSHQLTLLERSQGEKIAEKERDKVLYEAKLAEECFKEDPASCDPRRIPTFHGFSASGNVTAQYVYVNYGTVQDYEDLIKANITLKGKIAIARYDKVWRGMKVMRAQLLGMVAVILYTDPGADAFQEANGELPYPYGYARQPSSVQRGSVLSINWQPGDPSTPGYPSLPGSVRIVPEDMEWLPRIPSLPISYEDAAPLLEALNGQGPSATSMGKSWEGGGLGYRGVEYNVGPSAPEVLLRVVNDQAYEFTTIHNLIAVVNGTEEDEVVLIGNHHDAWTLGGAADPHSGSAALNEIVRSFGKALGKGWKPRRTLVFARWDAEEYAMIGSTEWVEEHLPWLSDTGVAYINVDPGVTGSKFYASAAPLIHELLRRSTESVLSPNQTIPGQTLADLWESGIETLGGGSDFGAFQHHAGIVSVDMNFQFSEDAPPFHYHSQYDSITYMERIIDPDFLYHKALAQLWGLMTAELVDAPILPFNVTDYATALEAYIDDVKKGSKQSHSTAIREHRFDNLTSAADRFLDTAITFDREALALSQTICRKKGWFVRWRPWQENHLKSKAKRVNGKLRALERQFLYEGGLDDRPWFKHTIFAPGYWEGYSGVTLPGLRETIASDDEEGVSRWEKIITKALHQASDLLEQ